MFHQLPTELNQLIFVYANMRYHAGKVSTKLSPTDVRWDVIDTHCQKRYTKNTVTNQGIVLRKVLRITRFKYICLNKYIDLSLGLVVEIVYKLQIIFTYDDPDGTIPMVYPLNTETTILT